MNSATVLSSRAVKDNFSPVCFIPSNDLSFLPHLCYHCHTLNVLVISWLGVVHVLYCMPSGFEYVGCSHCIYLWVWPLIVGGGWSMCIFWRQRVGCWHFCFRGVILRGIPYLGRGWECAFSEKKGNRTSEEGGGVLVVLSLKNYWKWPTKTKEIMAQEQLVAWCKEHLQ